MLFIRGLRLLADNLVPGSGVLRCQRDHVLLAQAGDGAGKNRFHSFALADLPRNGRRQRCVFGFTQVLHALHQVLLTHDFDYRRLLQIDLQRLVQRGVKDRVAGVVNKIGQDERVFR